MGKWIAGKLEYWINGKLSHPVKLKGYLKGDTGFKFQI